METLLPIRYVDNKPREGNQRYPVEQEDPEKRKQRLEKVITLAKTTNLAHQLAKIKTKKIPIM